MRTPHTIRCDAGDVILVPFKFAESDDVKARPAVIVSVAEFQASRADAIMLALTGSGDRTFFGDCEIVEWRAAGLLKPTGAKGVLRTIHRSLVYQHLGTLTDADYRRVKDSLRSILGLADEREG